MERRELLERLAPLIPPPRAHQVRYHGVLACLALSSRAPPLEPANEIDLGPEFGDSAVAQKLGGTQTDADFDFDQSVGASC